MLTHKREREATDSDHVHEMPPRVIPGRVQGLRSLGRAQQRET